MVFEPQEAVGDDWLANAIVGGLNWIVDSVNNLLTSVGLSPVTTGEFYVKEGKGYLPLATATVSLKNVQGIGALLSAIAVFLWTLTKIGFVVKLIDVVDKPAQNWGWYLLLGVGVVAFVGFRSRR